MTKLTNTQIENIPAEDEPKAKTVYRVVVESIDRAGTACSTEIVGSYDTLDEAKASYDEIDIAYMWEREWEVSHYLSGDTITKSIDEWTCSYDDYLDEWQLDCCEDTPEYEEYGLEQHKAAMLADDED